MDQSVSWAVAVLPLLIVLAVLVLLLAWRWTRWLGILLLLLTLPGMLMVYKLRSWTVAEVQPPPIVIRSLRPIQRPPSVRPAEVAEMSEDESSTEREVISTKVGPKKATVARSRAAAAAPAKNRPAWVDAEDGEVGGTYEMTVRVGPFNTEQECRDDLNPKILAKVSQFVARIWPAAATADVHPDISALRADGLVAEEYLEPVETSFGPMKQLYVRLNFNAKVYKYLAAQTREAVVAQRLAYAAAGLASVLGGLAVVWAGLRWSLRRHC